MEKKLRVIIVDDNKEFVELLSLFIDSQTDMQTVAKICDGKNIIENIQNLNPDILLLDIVMPNVDGIKILEELKELKEKNKIKIIIMSLMGQDKIIKNAIDLGALYYILKPFDMQILVDRLRMLSDGNNNNLFEKKENEYILFAKDKKVSIEAYVSKIIHDLGIPAHIKGYKYLRESIIMTLNDPEVISAITKFLYPTLSKKFKTTPTRVERAIRHAIDIAWDRGNVKTQNNFFGYSSALKKGRPTNSEFIAMVSDKISLSRFEKENI